jgi:FixJ family two-component response regulator
MASKFSAQLAHAGVGIPIIFITGHGDIPMTVKAMKLGAVEFLTKPFNDRTCWMRSTSRWTATAPRASTTRSSPSCSDALPY